MRMTRVEQSLLCPGALGLDWKRMYSGSLALCSCGWIVPFAAALPIASSSACFVRSVFTSTAGVAAEPLLKAPYTLLTTPYNTR